MAVQYGNNMYSVGSQLNALAKQLNIQLPYEIHREEKVDPGEYHYFATFVVSLGQRVAPSGDISDITLYVSKIWANGEVIFDAGGYRMEGLDFTLFDGAEDQGEVFRGMHYRGQTTILFRNLKLTDFSNTVPAITVELIDGKHPTETETPAIHKRFVAYDPRIAGQLELDAASGILYKKAFNVVGDVANDAAIRVTVGNGVATAIVNVSPDSTGSAYWTPAAWFTELNMFINFRVPLGDAQTAHLYRLENGTPQEVTTLILPAEYDDPDATDLYPASSAIDLTLTVAGRRVTYCVMLSYATELPMSLQVMQVSNHGMTEVLREYQAVNNIDAPSYMVKGKSEGSRAEIYVVSAFNVAKLIFTAAGPSGLQVEVVNDLYTTIEGTSIRKAIYDYGQGVLDPEPGRLLLWVAGDYDTTGSIIPIYGNDAAGTPSGVIPMPPFKPTEILDNEATSDYSQRVVYTSSGESTNTLVRVNLTSMTATTINIPVTIDPQMHIVTDGKTGRVYLPDLSYLVFGVSTPGTSEVYTLEEIVRAYGAHVGLDNAHITVDNIDHKTVRGYVVADSMPYAALLTALGGFYRFGWYEQAGQLYVKAPAGADGVVAVDHLLSEDMLHTQHENSDIKLNVVRRNDEELPASISLSYYDANADLSPGSQLAQRHIAAHNSPVRLEWTIGATLDGKEALEHLYAVIVDQWESRTEYSFRIDSNGIKLSPLDVVSIIIDQTSYQLEVQLLRVNADQSVNVQGRSLAGAAYPAAVVPQPPRVTAKTASPVQAVAFEAPDTTGALTTEDHYNVLVFAGGYVPGTFKGAVFETQGSGGGWSGNLAFTPEEQSGIGTLTQPLGLWDDPTELDTVNSIYITQGSVEAQYLQSRAPSEIVNNTGNLVAVVYNGRAEYIQFTEANEVEEGVWRLSGLIRGRFGTETFAQVFPVGSPVAFMESPHKVFTYTNADYASDARIVYRARGRNQSANETTPQTLHLSGDSRRPYAPVEIKAVRELDDALTISWARRARYYNNPTTPYTPAPPLDEQAALFELRVFSDLDPNGATLLGSMEVSGTDVTLSLAQQDGLGLSGTETSLYIEVVQRTTRNIRHGFYTRNELTVYATGSVFIGAVFSLGGSMGADIEIPDLSTVELAAEFELGGATRLYLAVGIPAVNISADMSAGGSLHTNVRVPITLSTTAELGGEQDTLLVSGFGVAANISLGGDMGMYLEVGAPLVPAAYVGHTTSNSGLTAIDVVTGIPAHSPKDLVLSFFSGHIDATNIVPPEGFTLLKLVEEAGVVVGAAAYRVDHTGALADTTWAYDNGGTAIVTNIVYSGVDPLYPIYTSVAEADTEISNYAHVPSIHISAPRTTVVMFTSTGTYNSNTMTAPDAELITRQSNRAGSGANGAAHFVAERYYHEHTDTDPIPMEHQNGAASLGIAVALRGDRKSVRAWDFMSTTTARIQITGTQGNHTFNATGMNEIEYIGHDGTPLVHDWVNITAHGTSSGDVSNLIDGNIATGWAGHRVGGVGWVDYWQLMPRGITGVRIHAGGNIAPNNIEFQEWDDTGLFSGEYVPFARYDTTEYFPSEGGWQEFWFGGRWWRINILDSFQSTNWTQVQELEFRTVPGVSETAAEQPGIAIGTKADAHVGNAFDGDPDTGFFRAAGPNTVGYAFKHYKEVREVAIMAPGGSSNNRAPRHFLVQYSIDHGLSWQTIKTVGRLPDWAPGEWRTFPIPATTEGDYATYLSARFEGGGETETNLDVIKNGHRYWRLLITANNGWSSGITQITELEFYSTRYGPNIAYGGVASASSSFSGTNAGMAFDQKLQEQGIQNSWASVNTGGVFPHWVKYDFGAGNGKYVNGIGISVNRNPSTATQEPKDFKLQWSDDDISWTDHIAVTGETWTATKFKKWYAEDTPTPEYSGSPYGEHAYWRLNIMAPEDASRSMALGELGFRATPDGATQTTGGTAVANSSYNSAENQDKAFDNDPATNWASVDAGNTNAGYIGYIFPAPVSVAAVSIQNRASSVMVMAPRDFSIRYSDDGVHWSTAWGAGNQTGWAYGETRVFVDPDYNDD